MCRRPFSAALTLTDRPAPAAVSQVQDRGTALLLAGMPTRAPDGGGPALQRGKGVATPGTASQLICGLEGGSCCEFGPPIHVHPFNAWCQDINNPYIE